MNSFADNKTIPAKPGEAICRRRGRKIGICGQAPSDYPDFEQGINSISLNPDTVLKTTLAILEKERTLKT